MTNATTLGGPDANATGDTMPRLCWLAAVEMVCIATVGQGVCGSAPSVGDWLRAEPQRVRMNRAYSAGEPVWMAADAMIAFARGARLAASDNDGDRAAIRAAWRKSMEVE